MWKLYLCGAFFLKKNKMFRIWGEQGQAALEKATICLLNCGPTGSETLKNLVLGGVGSITVIDGSKVELGDLGNNFMGGFVFFFFFLVLNLLCFLFICLCYL
jgi:hypothetical protein